MTIARKHADASSLAARPLVSESVFMSILTSMMGTIRDVNARLDMIESRLATIEAARDGRS